MSISKPISRPFGRAPLRVMHVITPSRIAGAETFLMRLSRHANSQQLALRCIANRNRIVPAIRAEGLEIDSLGIGGKANLLAVPRLRRAARRFQADLMHSHLSSASWWCGWLEQIGGPRSIGHVHGFTSAIWHSRQSHMIACSAAVKADLIDKGLSADRISVMHYPVGPSDQLVTRLPALVRAELGAEPETPVVGTFAHLSRKKGYRELIQAAEIVLRQIPRAQFWCFGDGPLKEELTEQARLAGIADRFKLFGFRRDVADLMRAIDVMCLPSRREPFGLVYVEAGLAGKPVIACDGGGAPEIISEGENGLLVPPPFPQSALDEANKSRLGGLFGRSRQAKFPPPQNVDALADAILTLLDNPAHSRAMGRHGRELALERFTWPKYLAQLQELYERVLACPAEIADYALPAPLAIRRAA
jgi:glycosyltransferase involved in cell wall biosynthesis